MSPWCQAQGAGEKVVKGIDVVPGLSECIAKRRGCTRKQSQTSWMRLERYLMKP